MKPPAMTEDELAALLAAQERQAVGYYTSEIAGEQARAIDYYYGLPFGDEQEGRSKVVDHVVAEVVDNALAALLKPFVSSDETVRFLPRSAEDVEQAEQASEYVNYVFNSDNPGFQILHDWFKAALLEKLGIVKIWWEDKSGPQKANHRRIGPDDAENLMQREVAGTIADLEITDNGDGTYSATFSEEYEDGCVRVETVPSEEFLITPLTANADEAPYIAHRTRVTRSSLLSMGFDPAVVDGLSRWGDDQKDDVRSLSRYRDEEWSAGTATETDRSQDLIEVCHEFPLVDFDGDGKSERREVIRSGDKMLLNVERDNHPFALLCPIPMPHKVYGLSLADQVIDLQRISSVLTRQMLDNLYLSNNPRIEVPEAAERMDGTTFEDLQTTDPGAAIRTRAGGQLASFTVPFVGDKVLMALQWADQQQEARTGISAQGQGMDRDTLKKQTSATEAAIDDNRRNERADMIARIFAETGVKTLFRKILKLVSVHQPRARVIRLRNEWVEMDPRGWNAEMDMAISVGLGVGNKREQAASMMQALEVSERLAMSPFSSLVNKRNVYEQVKKLFHALGIKNTDDYLTEPQEGEQEPPPPPSPEAIKAQADAQAMQAKLQLEQGKAQADMEMAQQKAQFDALASAADLEMRREEAAAKLDIARETAALQAELARDKAQQEMLLADRKMEAEFLLAERRMEMEERIALASAAANASAKVEAAGLSANRPGGDLSK